MITLLNDGGFIGLSEVAFPLRIPEGKVVHCRSLGIIKVDLDFMLSVGAVYKEQDIGWDSYYVFIAGEYEVVE